MKKLSDYHNFNNNKIRSKKSYLSKIFGQSTTIFL